MLYLLEEIKTFQSMDDLRAIFFLEIRTVPHVINKCIKLPEMQALKRSGVEKTQLKSLCMTYWKSNIIFTNSTRKPLQMARN